MFLLIVVCPFVLFLLAIVLSVLFLYMYTDSDCPFGIFKLFLNDLYHQNQYLIDNIFIMFGGRVFQRRVVISMGTNCGAPIPTDLLLNSYEADFIYHGYVPLLVNTSRSFPHSWLITGFVTRLTQRVSLVENEEFTSQKYCTIVDGSWVEWSVWTKYPQVSIVQ
jgi:hypothetical protein